MEERVAGEHGVAVGEQPLVDLSLLRVGRVQVVPGVGAAAAGPQAGDAQLCAIAVGECLEPVELIDVVAGDHHRDLERSVLLDEPGSGEVVHCRTGRCVRPLAAHRVVGGRVETVEADLDVEVVHRREPLRVLLVDERAVGGELHADAHAAVGRCDRVVEQLEEVAAHHRLAAADVDVEHLQLAQLVEHPLCLVGGQLTRVALARRRQAVHALQVARVCELPREADRRVEPALELFNQRLDAHARSPMLAVIRTPWRSSPSACR